MKRVLLLAALTGAMLNTLVPFGGHGLPGLSVEVRCFAALCGHPAAIMEGSVALSGDNDRW
jgi:hypothetical protein